MGTNFTTATKSAFPLGATRVLPIAPANTTATYEAVTPAMVAAMFSGTLVSLSSYSKALADTGVISAPITSDAAGLLAFGSIAPSGTDQTANINATMAAAYSAANGTPITIIWDVAVSLSGPAKIPGSNCIIWAPNYGCGAIMRANSSANIWRLAAMDADMTIAANSQKSFGKYDPGAPGGSHAYRVFDPSYVWVQNVGIIGGTWNGNCSAQPNYTVQDTGQVSGTYGLLSSINFWGVDGCYLRGMHLNQSLETGIRIINFRRVFYDDIEIDNGDNSGNVVNGQGGIQINGPGLIIRGGAVLAKCGDDPIAIMPDDWTYNYGGLVQGVNAPPGGGNITDVIVQGPDLWTGSLQASAGNGCVRLQSNYHLLDNVRVAGARGIGNTWGVKCYPDTAVCAGDGNYGHIQFVDHQADVASLNSPAAPLVIGGNIQFLEVERYRYDAQNDLSDIYLTASNSSVINKAHFKWDGFQPAGAGYSAEPAITVGCIVNELIVKGSLTADSSISPRAAPFVLTATGAAIAYLELTVRGDAITNLVDHEAGTITTCVLAGAHTNAGGGSPINVAGGLTITNLIYPNLVWKSGTAVKSGSGTVTTSSASGNAYTGP